MPFSGPPPWGAWRHRGAREGFEVVFVRSGEGGYRLEGGTAAVEGGEGWVVDYLIAVNSRWVTRNAVVSARSGSGAYELVLEADGAGHWRINGLPASHLEGCLDVDLESSALTNAFPPHRLALELGQAADAPAAYVRAADLAVERLEQRYVRLEDDRGRERYRYTAPGFEFECQLLYDEFGLVVEYPGIAVRAA
jgi:uncharacterized protein